MDLISDINQDFVTRSRDELDLIEEGLAEWQTAPNDPEKLTCLAEILRSLQELSGLLAFPRLESLFNSGHIVLLMVRQRWPQPCLDLIADLQELLKNGRRLLSEMEARQIEEQAASHSGSEIAPLQTPLGQPSGPPSPFRRRGSLRGPANSLTDFIIENLAHADANPTHETPQMGTRLVRLIDEVMTARHQIRQILTHALSLSSEHERSAYLNQSCATCPELRSSLERLLKSETQTKRLLLFPASELIRALLESLRGEMLLPGSHGPPVELTVPGDDVIENDVKATVHVRPSSTFVPPVTEAASDDPTAFPRSFGRYTLERELGRGAMGTVLLASDRLLNRHVALKLLRTKSEDGHEIVKRFYREARSMASLQHANLCPIYDFGEVDGQPYLTMAFISGRPLSDYLIGGRPLVTRYAVTLARTLAMALHQAHQVGIVHRDLKPANVMINKEAEPILMDFGLARRQQPGELEITQEGMILGSPAYMAPEQVEGKIDQIGPVTDVHALGVILYEMLSGRKPFDGSVVSVLAQIQSKDPDPLNNPGDPDGRLDAICRRAMAKAISHRYATALEFAEALTEYLEDANRIRLAPEVDLNPDPVTESAKCESVNSSATRRTQMWIHPERRRRRWQWTAAVAALICISLATVKLRARSPSDNIPLKIGSSGTLRTSR